MIITFDSQILQTEYICKQRRRYTRVRHCLLLSVLLEKARTRGQTYEDDDDVHSYQVTFIPKKKKKKAKESCMVLLIHAHILLFIAPQTEIN